MLSEGHEQTHSGTHPHALKDAHAHAHNADIQTYAYANTCTYTHSRTHPQTHTYTHAHTHTHAHAHAHTHAHTHTHVIDIPVESGLLCKTNVQRYTIPLSFCIGVGSHEEGGDSGWE